MFQRSLSCSEQPLNKHASSRPRHRSIALAMIAGVALNVLVPCLVFAEPPASEPATETLSTPEFVEVLPGLRLNRKGRVLEFDGSIPIEISEKARTFLEVIVCGKDTREHEALVVTDLKASALHAGLLLLALEPGSPGGWNREGDKPTPIAPRGAEVEVRVVISTQEGEREIDPMDWIIHATSGRTLREIIDAKRSKTRPVSDDTAKTTDQNAASEQDTQAPIVQHQTDFVFAGSVFVPSTQPGEEKEIYKADLDGTLIGLHTFSSETIAWTDVHDPDAGTEEPVWIANTAAMMSKGVKRGDAVRVRLRAIEPAIVKDASHGPDDAEPQPNTNEHAPSQSER